MAELRHSAARVWSRSSLWTPMTIGRRLHSRITRLSSERMWLSTPAFCRSVACHMLHIIKLHLCDVSTSDIRCGLSLDCLHMVRQFYCHPTTPSSLASLKSRVVVYLWHQLSQVVLEKRLIVTNVLWSVCVGHIGELYKNR